jgi:ribosomal-protein-alanine N-acetyltransferase
MKITDAEPHHVPQIGELENLCFSLPWAEETLRSQISGEGNIFLVALDNDAVIGYIGLLFVLDEGYISNVAVSPAYRRQGVGRALIEALLQRAEKLGLSFVTLEVRASNTAAQALYADCGFLVAGLRRSYYEGPREDAVLMTKTIVRDTENHVDSLH